MRPRFLYLHGFASGPGSRKGVVLADHLARLGADLQRLDLRVPTLAHLRLSRMIDVAQTAIGGPADRAVVFGSSLGGLCAARLAERDPRVAALVLLAPAFNLADRWRTAQPTSIADWSRTGWLRTTDHTTGASFDLDYGFFEDVAAIDRGAPPDVRVPTLIFHGRDDATVGIESSRTFAASRPHVQLVELDDGHELIASLPQIAADTERWMVPWLGRA